MENLASKKVGEIVAENFRTSKVFTAHKIDFCCGGGVTLEEACSKTKQDLNEVIGEIEQALLKHQTQNWQELELDVLIDSIIDVHHSYVRATIPTLSIYLNKLCKVHGEQHPELFEIRDLFEQGAGALLEHMNKEEQVLFPYVKAMVQSKRSGFSLSKPHFQHIDNPIDNMEAEHEMEGARFNKIAQLSHEYTCPGDGCQTYRVTYALLEEFEQDLHKHIHLENNILFPSAKKLYENFEFKT